MGKALTWRTLACTLLPMLAAADVYRPAAIKQSQTLGRQIDVTVYEEGTSADPIDIAQNAIAFAKERGYNTVIRTIDLGVGETPSAVAVSPDGSTITSSPGFSTPRDRRAVNWLRTAWNRCKKLSSSTMPTSTWQSSR